MEIDSERGGVVVVVPFDVAAVWQRSGPVPVEATFDGFPLRTALVPLPGYETPTHGLPVPKEVRGAIDKTWGDTVQVTLRLDTAPRPVTVPPDFTEALNMTPGANTRFDQLTYAQQRAFVRWVEASKNREVRRERVVQAAEQVAAGKKRQ